MELKHFIFLGLSLGFVPFAAWVGITFRWGERLLVAGLFFSTCYLIDINILSMEWYRGDTRGFEFGLTDLMLISLLLVMLFSPRWKHRRLSLLPPNATLMLAYFTFALVSAVFAYVSIYSGFGIFKLMRAMAIYWIAYNYIRSEEDLRFIISILAAIVAFEFLLALQQRFSGGYRVTGSMPHPNTLAVYINMMNMIFFAFILGEQNKGKRKLVYWACLCMGTVTVLATFSRGGLASMLLGYTLVLFLSFYDRLNFRKFMVIGILLLLSVPVALKFAPAIIDRFVNAPVSATESRHLANNAATSMANSHFFGVGINNYSHAINETNFSSYIDKEADRGIAHNIYLLHASEMGWIGMAIFILMIANFMWMGIRMVSQRSNNSISIMATGITAAMSVLWLQSALEWLFRQTYITVEFYMLAGILAALGRLGTGNRNTKPSETCAEENTTLGP